MKKSKIFSVRGGIRKGSSYWFALNLTWPLVKMEVFNNKIIFYLPAPLTRRFHLKKSEILYLREYRGFPLLGKGIQILHKNPYEDKFIIFWTFKTKYILAKLKKAGYNVK